MQIIISSRIKGDIDNIYNYLAQYSIKNANKTVEKIYAIIYSIKDFPYIGRCVPELWDKQFRERIYKDFRIIYYISEINNTIYIRYIFSSKQNEKLFFNIHKKDFSRFLNQNFI